MFYESYEQKILKVAKVKDFFHRFRILFLSIFALVILLTSGYLTTKGMIIKEITVSQAIKYGENIDANAEALFTDIEYYEYKHSNSNEWSTTKPTEIGEYEVRAVVKKSFGRNGYSDSASFEVLPQPLTITIDSSSVVYGSQPIYSVEGLVKGDKFDVIEFNFEDVKLVSTKVSLDLDTVKIVNSNGDNVTKAYAITCEVKDVNITSTDLEIKLNDVTKEYDGEAFVYDESYEITSGELYFGDSLNITTTYGKEGEEAINVGVYENSVISSSLYNNSVNVGDKYNVTFKKGNIIITERSITIKTPSVTQVYNSQELKVTSVDDCEVIEGSLVEGHELVYISSPSIMHVGTLTNSMILMIVDEAGNDVTRNYDIKYEYGTLEVLQKDIVVTLEDVEKYYDGTGYQEATPFTLSEELYDGDSINVIAEAKGAKDVGTYTLEVINIDFSAGGVNAAYLTDYNFICKSSTLTIKRRPVIIFSFDYEITYGELYDVTSYDRAFVLDEPTGAQDVYLIDGSRIAINVKFEDLKGNVVNPAKEYLDAGDYNIVITSHNKELDKNYEVSYETATFKVNKRDVILTAAVLPSKEYDSLAFEYPSEKFDLYDKGTQELILGFEGEIAVEFLQFGDVVEPINAGTYQMKVVSYSENFNKNYNVDTYKLIDFTITPCVVEISYINPLQTKIYDKELFDNYDLSFDLISTNHTFLSPYLFNNDMVRLDGMYTEYINETDKQVENLNEAIDSGKYILRYTNVFVTDELGNDVSSNYLFECDGLILEILKRNIEITPNSDEIEYYGDVYYYEKYSFIATDLDGELDINSLISDLNPYISVQYSFSDEELNDLGFIEAIYAGNYNIYIKEYDNNLNRNYNVTTGIGSLVITPCNVTIGLKYSEKVYDGTNTCTFDTTYTLSTEEAIFEPPYLYNGDLMTNVMFYLGDYEGNRVEAINVGSYYLHVDLTYNTVVNLSASNSYADELVNNSYTFDYEPVEVKIIPRDVTLIARTESSKVAYNGEVQYYNNDLFTVYLDNGEYTSATNLIDNSQIKVYVSYYDSYTEGEYIDQINVKNARNYYIEIDSVEFITGSEDNYNISFGDRVKFEIIPVDVDIRFNNNQNYGYFDGEVYDDGFTYALHRSAYDKNGNVIGGTSGLIGNDDISIEGAVIFRNYSTLEEATGIDAGKYKVYVDTSKITFISGGNDSVITNYKFTNTTSGYCEIYKREISISAVDQGSIEYNGDAYNLYNSYEYIVSDNTNPNMDYEFLLNILNEYGVYVTPVYVNKQTSERTYYPVNAGEYDIEVEINSMNYLFDNNFNYKGSRDGSPSLTITQKHIVFKPVAQIFGYEDKPFEYPDYQYEIIEDTYLCKDYHYASLEVYYMKDGKVLENAPKEIYEFYEIYIKSVKIYENGEDISLNYDIDWYTGNDVYLNIFRRLVKVMLNQQESVYYGEDYSFDPYDLIIDGGLEGSYFKANIHYINEDGSELPDEFKYHPINAGFYKIVIDSVEVEGKYPATAYDIEITGGNELFEIMHRKATITPVINEVLTYNFNEVLPYTYSLSDITKVNKEKNNGLLPKDISNISFDILIDGGMTTEFIYAGEYSLDIIRDSLTGVENYDITLETSYVTVNKLGITVELEAKSKVYDGTPLAFVNEYKIYTREKDITDLLDVYIYVTYNKLTEIINAGTYTARVEGFDIYNYGIDNFAVTYKNALYEIKKADILISYDNPVQVFDYNGSKILFDGSFTVDSSTPLVLGEEITLKTYYKDSSGKSSATLPVHSGTYEAYMKDYVGPNNTQNYNVTATNSVMITVNKLEIVLSLLDKTHYYSGELYEYPTIFNSYIEDVYKVEGYVVPGEQFDFVLSYYSEDGKLVSPIYNGTYEMVLEPASIKTYVSGIESTYQDYIITISDNATLTIESNYVNTNTVVEDGFNTYEYDATNNYKVTTTYFPAYYLSSNLEIRVTYNYYDSEENLLDEKPINAGIYYVGIKGYEVYKNNRRDYQADECIDLEIGHMTRFEITKRVAYLYVQDVSKTYDGVAFDEEIPVIEERFIPGHELTYTVSYLDAPYYEIIDVKEGGYRISIDRDSIMFTDSSLKDNYEIIVNDAVIYIDPVILYLVSTLTFDKTYDGLNVEYTGAEWDYATNVDGYTYAANRPVGNDAFNVVFEFFGERDTEFGYQEFRGEYANEAYVYTIRIADIIMTEGKRTNYEIVTVQQSTGNIKRRPIEVATGTKEAYYTGQDFSYAAVELLEGYSLVEGHVFTYLGYEPTIIYGYEGIKTKENNVPFGVVDEMGKNVSPNYFTQNVVYGTISTIPRPITITTEGREMQYNGQAQSWSGYSTNSEEVLEDGFTALIEGHEIKKTSKRTKVTDITDDIGVDNVLGFKIVDEDGNEVTDYYNIEYIYGKLKIVPYEIHVSLLDQTVGFTGYIYDPSRFIVSKDSEGNILQGLPVAGDSFYFQTFVEQSGDIEVIPEEPTDPSINTYPGVPASEPIEIPDFYSSDLLYVGNYTVYIENLVVHNANGDDVTRNYVIVYDSEESFDVEITKATLNYTSNSASKIWDGTSISEQSNYFDEWEFLNVHIVVTAYTTLNPYDPVTGEAVYFANTENIHTIKVFDTIYGNDITESCLNIIQHHGMLEFTDTLNIEYYGGKEFDNNRFELKEDENGRYLDFINVYGNYGSVNNHNLKIYVTDILDQNGNSVSEILNVDYYTFIIDKTNTRVVSNGVDLTSMMNINYHTFTYNITPKPIVVRPAEKNYTYDGNEIKYEGFDVAEIIYGSICEGHVFYLNTTINEETTLKTNKMNKKQNAYITDIAIYEVDEYGNMILYEEWERNYTVCYYNYNTRKIVNKDIIPEYFDEEKGQYVDMFTQADLYSTFKCSRIQLIVSTPASQKDYDGEYIRFDASECTILNPEVLLPNHSFLLPEGYWLSAKTYSNSKGFVNTIGANYWGVFVNGDKNSSVTQFYELVQTQNTCGKIIIREQTIVIESSNLQKYYDGTPLTNYGKELTALDFYLASGYKLADGDYINYEKSTVSRKTSITYVGEIENKFNVKIYNKYGQDVTAAYDIIEEWGSLIILPNAN